MTRTKVSCKEKFVHRFLYELNELEGRLVQQRTLLRSVLAGEYESVHGYRPFAKVSAQRHRSDLKSEGAIKCKLLTSFQFSVIYNY